MSNNTKVTRDYFSKVRVARELLREKADELLKQYMLVVDEARASGDYETAAKALQWLIDHMPEEDGVRIIDQSVDKKQEPVQQQQTGPQIRIGIAVGGLGQHSLPNQKKPKEISGEVVDGEEV